MKAARIIFILSLVAVASVAYVWLQSIPEVPSVSEPEDPEGSDRTATNEAPVEAREPVQPLEERGDAMLFEIDALQNTPFDEAIVAPFD